MNRFITTIFLFTCMPQLVLAAQIDGQLDWAKRVVLGTPVSGVIAEVPAKPGMQVKKGDVLLKLDQTNFNAHVRQARAQANKTRYAYEEEQRQWERAQELYERTVTSTRELKVSEISYQAAKADYNTAQAELVLARQALADSVIKAPFDGVVVATHVSPAETVVTRLQQVPMVTLGMIGRYHVVGSVDESAASSLSVGLDAQVEIGGRTISGKIVYVAVEPENGSYTVKAEFDSGQQLRIGTKARIITP